MIAMHLRTTSTAVLFVAAMISFQSFAGNNLPQLQTKVTIKGKNHRQLKNYFKPLTGSPESLDSTIERIVVNALPKEFKRGCSDMISNWGKKAKGTSSVLPQILYLYNPGNSPEYILLALVCYSNAREYGNRFYDERLALLTIDSTSSTLRMISNAPPCDHCTELTHIEFEDELKAGGKPIASIGIATSTKNPCCRESVAVQHEMNKLYSFENGDVKELLSIVRLHKETVPRTDRTDSVTMYVGEIHTEKDEDGNITNISFTGETTNDNKLVKRIVRMYKWNPKRRTFDDVTP